MLQDKLIECDKSTIDAIAQSIESVPGVKILHIDMGQDAHRTVITFVGYPEACKEAAYRSILTGTQLIDMRTHQGAHPRIGAVDVFPFVPLVNTTMQEAIDCVLEVLKESALNFYSLSISIMNQLRALIEKILVIFALVNTKGWLKN